MDGPRGRPQSGRSQRAALPIPIPWTRLIRSLRFVRARSTVPTGCSETKTADRSGGSELARERVEVFSASDEHLLFVFDVVGVRFRRRVR